MSATQGRAGSPIRHFNRHQRIWIALAVCISSVVFAPAGLPLITRLLISWNCGVTLFLVAIYFAFNIAVLRFAINITAGLICS